MKVHLGGRAFLVAAVVAATAVLVVGFFAVLGVRSGAAGPGSAPAAAPANPGHPYSQVDLPVGTWTGLNADLLDGAEAAGLEESAEIDTDIATHTAIPSAHHTKTTSASEIVSGTMAPERIDGTAWTSLNDGALSGLNADLLDGQEASAFAGATHNHNATDVNAGALSTDRYSAIADLNAEGLLGGILPGTMWHSNNDGATSGLDADTLDGLNSTQIQDADNYVSNAGYCTTAGEADTLDSQHGAYYRDATNMNAGTLSTDRYGAYSDLGAEFYLGDAAGDLARNNGARQVTLNADLLDGQDSTAFAGASHNHDVTYWKLTGNSGTGGSNFLGTTDNQALELKVNSSRALRLEPNATSPNVIGGYSGNSVTTGAYGAAICGGGDSSETNSVTDNYGTVAGGAANQAGNNAGTTSDAPYNTVGGGEGNVASASEFFDPYWYGYATVAGGASNTASGIFTTIGGGIGNTAIERYAAVGGGMSNDATGRWSTVAGGSGNLAGAESFATVGGGYSNDAQEYGATIAGGYNNEASEFYSAVGGGFTNAAGGSHATIAGGANNLVTDDGATVGGGGNNQAGDPTTTGGNEEPYATVAGGQENTATNDWCAVGGGYSNEASGLYATIPGGLDNTASGNYSFAAGRRAKADDQGAFVWADSTDADLNSTAVNQFLVRANGGVSLNVTSGGLDLESNATSPNVIGGYSGNTVTSGAYGAAICGGGSSGNTNSVTDNYGAVCGGYSNQAGDGAGSTADKPYATVGGGYDNTASGNYSTIGGGDTNTASGSRAAVGGGYSNDASGNYSAIPAGYDNTASGMYSFAAGYQAQATNSGSFVWSSAETTSSWGNNTFTARTHGGARFYTASGTTTGVVLASGGGSWSSLSDRNQKENFTPVDGQEVLALLADIPITTWNLKSQDPSIRHMGPMSQDFSAAFGLGEDERYIGTLDADGVALAAIQGLYGLAQEQAARIQTLEEENGSLQQRLGDLEARVTALEGGAPANDGSAGLLPSGLTVWWLLSGGLVVAGLALVQRRRAGGRP